MDLEAMEAAMVGEESSGSWSSSTNWVAAEGFLRDSISFETSDDDAPALTSSGLLLVRPPSDYPPPCEVTILFREKHEIHRVYVRSTARVYEIYYAADRQNKSKEYLCTVRCGPAAAASEVMPPSSSEGAITKSQNGNDGTMEKHEKMARSDSNNSVEDGWVEVKVPDSPQQNDQANALSKKVDGNSSANFQIHYEATAEISDASPCAALTLRLLSLQTKTCVHVEEIYIYADPVDSPNPDPHVSMEGNLSGNPLLAMLVPGLLQLSKSGTSRIQNKYFSVDSGVREHQHCVDKAAEQSRLDMCGTGLRQANCGMMQQNFGLLQEETKVKPENIQLESGQNVIDQIDQTLGPLQEQTEVKPENVQLGSNQRVTDQADQELGPVQTQTEVEPEYVQLRSGQKVTNEVEPENIHLGSNHKVTDMDQVPNSVVEENNPASSHVEKVLDELVSRMGRIEAFCSRFEENMMKPLSCIEMRLQRLEQRFDSFAVGMQYSERNPCSRISAPEFSFDESDSENKGYNISFTVGEVTVSNDTSFPANDVAASVPESKMCPGLAVKAPEFCNEDDFSLSATDGATSVPESNMHPGLVVKAPEFPNEDEEFPNTDNTSDSSVKDCPNDNTPQSVDAALASALAAFLTSTTVKSPKRSPNVTEKPHWSSNGINNDSDSSPVGVSSEGSDKLFSKIDLETNGCGTLDVMKTTNSDDSLSSADVVGAPDTSLDESYLEDKGCDTSDAARHIAAFGGSSLFADNMNSSVSVPQISGLIFTAPEFPNEEDDFIDCDNTLDSGVENCFKDHEAAFLSSTNVKSPEHNSTLLGAALELFNGDNNELAGCDHTIANAPDPIITPDNNELASTYVEIPCEVGRGGTTNHGNNSESKVDLNQILYYLLPDGRLEHGEHAKLRHQNGSTEPTVGGSTADCMPLKDGMEQKDHGVKWDRSSSTEATAMEEGYFAQKVPHCMGFQSNGGISSKWHDVSWVDDGDAEEAAHGSPCLNQLSREWTEDCSTDSSFDENFVRSKVQIYWSDDSSTDSFGRSFTVRQQSGQAAKNDEGFQALVDDFSVGIGLNSADSKSSAELKRAFDSKLDYEDRIMDFKFVLARDWGTRLPLELLLGETSDAEVQVSTVRDDGKCIADGQQHDLFSSQTEDKSSTAVNQLLVEVEDLRVRSETCLWDADLQGRESSNEQPFSSLI
ncbi:uncharacterized protein LOC103704564 [Phoenix dactylifera]|uniref:Uncharacterized protein LOC103704564 n=1 Tax=Phoenix dactylifera TaxID=42345 RepID=A0A8B7BVB8_PHODC|nr:uncharacterized protein LOC103704564 [Phoenix dactylifera]